MLTRFIVLSLQTVIVTSNGNICAICLYVLKLAEELRKLIILKAKVYFEISLNFLKKNAYEYVYVPCICVLFALFNIVYVDINVYLRQFLYKGNETLGKQHWGSLLYNSFAFRSRV